MFFLCFFFAMNHLLLFVFGAHCFLLVDVVLMNANFSQTKPTTMFWLYLSTFSHGHNQIFINTFYGISFFSIETNEQQTFVIKFSKLPLTLLFPSVRFCRDFELGFSPYLSILLSSFFSKAFHLSLYLLSLNYFIS